MIRRSGAVVAVTILALALAACSDGGGTATEPSAPAAETTDPAPEPTEATEPAPRTDGDLAALLLTGDDIPVAGWTPEPDDADEGYVDDRSGGICTLDLTDVLSAEQQAAGVDRTFTNEAVAGLLAEGLYAVADAETLVVDLATQLAACSGPYDGADGDTSVSVSSSPLSSVVPGAAVSVCRYHQTTLGGASVVFGPYCLAATGDRLLEVVAATPDPTMGIAPEDFEAVLTAMTAKAFTG